MTDHEFRVYSQTGLSAWIFTLTDVISLDNENNEMICQRLCIRSLVDIPILFFRPLM